MTSGSRCEEAVQDVGLDQLVEHAQRRGDKEPRGNIPGGKISVMHQGELETN